LPRLTPDYELSRLTTDGHDVFVDVRVGRVPPIKKAWRERPHDRDVGAAMDDIAKGLTPGARLSDSDALKALRGRLGVSVTRGQARNALKKYPNIRFQRGRHN
jgi:hypothetical protein